MVRIDNQVVGGSQAQDRQGMPNRLRTETGSQARSAAEQGAAVDKLLVAVREI